MVEKTIIEKNGEEWKTQIPETILTALFQRHKLPKYPFVHWYLLFDRKITAFRVTIGSSRGDCISELNGNETILPECVKNVVKGNVIFWKIIIRAGKPNALATIPDYYGISFVTRVLPTGIEIPNIAKEYIKLRPRSHLTWKKTENGWIVAKNLETYDFETFYAFNTLKVREILKNVSQVKITLTDYENKPAILIEPVPTRDPFETFLASLYETKIPIKRLYLLYRTVEKIDYKTFLELIKKHGLETRWEKDALQYRKKVVIIPRTNESPTVTPP